MNTDYVWVRFYCESESQLLLPEVFPDGIPVVKTLAELRHHIQALVDRLDPEELLGYPPRLRFEIIPPYPGWPEIQGQQTIEDALAVVSSE